MIINEDVVILEYKTTTLEGDINENSKFKY
jgi:hypothetical protein